MNTPIRSPSRILLLLLGTLLLLWQACLVYHQTGHAFSEPDESCPLCQAADHMQHGIATAAVVVTAPLPAPVDAAVITAIIPQFTRTPSARAPPFGPAA